ncbi:hypothetical protein HMPREF0083_03903 [Aneurinibacillus aneurinilyticus ATCC 12856]|uniref:Uncharacterized protein n=1 Tax=Aneurinibacillus aneurinilyticus ATCC 12856 TaxID=649747 RepID=U1Y765_ANEAE|nr:hypothetical protein HMPREF0083_03903 [Aneurinibacillus aneurinilyticus ATCC 12856]
MMTDKEKEKAYKGYEKFSKKHAFRKKYRDHKNAKFLTYWYSIGLF